METSEPTFMTTTSAALALQVAASTVLDLERRGILPATRTTSGVRLFRREDVDALAKERRKQAAAR